MRFGTQTRSENPAQKRGHLRILVVRIGAMGDVLHGLPAVCALRQALPECFIGWAIEPHWMPLLTNAEGDKPVVNHVHPVPTREWRLRPLEFRTGGEVMALVRNLRDMRYDVCVDLQGSTKSAIVGSMARAPEFFGSEHPREWAAGALYRRRVPNGATHVIQQACELLGRACDLVLQPAKVLLPVEEEAEGWCSGLLVRLGITKPFVLIAPAAGWGAKQWGAARFGEVARTLSATGYPVLINAAGEDGVADAVSKACGAPTIVSTLPQLTALARRAALVLGGDTGPVHLAAALGRPTVALFGPTDPARNGPFFPETRVQVMRHPASATTYKRSPDTESGLARLSADKVVETALAMLKENADG